MKQRQNSIYVVFFQLFNICQQTQGYIKKTTTTTWVLKEINKVWFSEILVGGITKLVEF